MAVQVSDLVDDYVNLDSANEQIGYGQIVSGRINFSSGDVDYFPIDSTNGQEVVIESLPRIAQISIISRLAALDVNSFGTTVNSARTLNPPMARICRLHNITPTLVPPRRRKRPRPTASSSGAYLREPLMLKHSRPAMTTSGLKERAATIR